MRDWKWNHKVKQHIMINGILDLNQYPSAKHEGTKKATKCLIIEVSTISHDISCPVSRKQSGPQAAVLPLLQVWAHLCSYPH